MALVVETGTANPLAESLASVADADARANAFGRASWLALDSTAKEVALRKATLFLAQYRLQWKGQRVTATQALDWPRGGVVVDDGYWVAINVIPAAVMAACMDLAFKVGDGVDLNPDLARTVIRKKVGPLETEYAPNAPESPRFPAIDALIAPYLKGGGFVSLSRA